MLEFLVQFFILMLVIAFSFVAIVGNYLRHQQAAALESARSDKEGALSPRLYALTQVPSQEPNRAA